ncbi:carboxylate-amine ligase [Nocardioides terrae]|uniref:Putative glutamate--cysteine ligase 2 n=1 Tax=Nocardioides terrae TaxID=574651 RepID=A0A1I1ND89_9ACTN|nr:glutamate--cysteine ligase [Nocardioides terrae]SFC95346.1 carboxylate-amine ligase [Nocardioides terrae]
MSRPHGSRRRLGVEEELLLSDATTGALRPVAGEVLAACQGAGDTGSAASLKHEFFLTQVEVATTPHAEIGEVRSELAGGRARIAEAGAAMGVAPLAVPGPVLALPSTDRHVSPGERYAAVERHYGETAHLSLMCAMHVHVEVADPDEGVAVIDRVRPWVPVLLAMSTNSPFWHGADTGHASWRSRVWNMWPTSGPAEPFGNADGYRARAKDMVARGAALDEGLINLDVRLSHRYPTVEFRVADVCTDLDDAMVIAALARALVVHFAARAGEPPDVWRVDELRVAAWRAARFGLADSLLSPVSRELVPAAEMAQELADLVAEALADVGDAELVRRGVETLAARGTGATRQREAFAAGGGLAEVVADLRERTVGRQRPDDTARSGTPA